MLGINFPDCSSVETSYRMHRANMPWWFINTTNAPATAFCSYASRMSCLLDPSSCRRIFRGLTPGGYAIVAGNYVKLRI